MAIVILGSKALAKQPSEPSVTPTPTQVIPGPQEPVQDGTKASDPISAALSLSAAPTPPWEVESGYSIFDALKEMGSPTKKGKSLWIAHKTNAALRYLVRSWDPSTSRAVLEGSKKSQLKPVLTEREAAIYYPLWL